MSSNLFAGLLLFLIVVWFLVRLLRLQFGSKKAASTIPESRRLEIVAAANLVAAGQKRRNQMAALEGEEKALFELILSAHKKGRYLPKERAEVKLTASAIEQERAQLRKKQNEFESQINKSFLQIIGVTVLALAVIGYVVYREWR